MGKTVLTANLSVKSMKKLQKDVKKYRDDLVKKCELFTKRLAEKGLQVAEAKVSESPISHYIHVKVDCDGLEAVLIAKGDVQKSDEYADFSTILAVEFGAGIHYNPVPNPKSAEMGYGVGTFPGQIHAFEDFWVYWNEETQEWITTHGIKATMPMYEAHKEMLLSVEQIAKEVFR